MGWCCCLFLVILIGCVILSLPKPEIVEEKLKQFLSSMRSSSRLPSSSYSKNDNKFYHVKEHLMSGETLGCYTCESRSGSDRRCDDGSYTATYQDSCVPREAGMSQGFGIFPHYCSKIVGLDMTTNTYVTIRGCSQRFRNECKSPILVNGRAIDGCIYSCSGKYCNSSNRNHINLVVVFITLLVVMTAFFSRNRIHF